MSDSLGWGESIVTKWKLAANYGCGKHMQLFAHIWSVWWNGIHSMQHLIALAMVPFFITSAAVSMILEKQTFLHLSKEMQVPS